MWGGAYVVQAHGVLAEERSIRKGLKSGESSVGYPKEQSKELSNLVSRKYYISPKLAFPSPGEPPSHPERGSPLTSARALCDWKNTASLWPHLRGRFSY